MREFKENINLSELSNYRIGGPARFFFAAKTPEEIAWAIKEAKDKELAVFVLGGGTNLLIKDEGWDGLVLKPNLSFLESNGQTVYAGAGVLMSDVLNLSVKLGLSGLEWAGGLPGTLGGAIRGNAGCFGGEIKDVISSVESFNTETGEIITRTNPDCGFAYRTSVFKEGGKEVILSATFSLAKGDSDRVAKAIQEKIGYRLTRHPMEHPNIGSIFKNVDLKKVSADFRPQLVHVVKKDPFPIVPTAYLISEAGLKGVSFGGAMISPKHPNFIVNTLDATASDVKNLIALVKQEVFEKFGIELEEEIMKI